MASLGIISDKARFHSVPVITLERHVNETRDRLYKGLYDDEAIERCSSTRGHILRVREKEIYCERCPAVWKDEGF